MKCPKCGGTENIKFFVRHQKVDEDDESTAANCITMLHADPSCGFNESFMLEDCLDYIFADWSELESIANRLNEIEDNINGMTSLLDASFVENDDAENIEDNDAEVVEDECESCMLPSVENEIEEEVINNVEVEDE